jgi:hypothetical protein
LFERGPAKTANPKPSSRLRLPLSHLGRHYPVQTVTTTMTATITTTRRRPSRVCGGRGSSPAPPAPPASPAPPLPPHPTRTKKTDRSALVLHPELHRNQQIPRCRPAGQASRRARRYLCITRPANGESTCAAWRRSRLDQVDQAAPARSALSLVLAEPIHRCTFSHQCIISSRPDSFVPTISILALHLTRLIRLLLFSA